MKGRVVLVVLIATLSLLATTFIQAADPLPQPANIRCGGREEDTVVVGWKDTADDETNYRVERKIGNGSWSEVETMSPDGDGNYEAYKDTGADVSQPNRYYRVRSYRASDDSYSPYSDVCNNRRIAETSDFRIFYGIEGQDACPDLTDRWGTSRDVCLADDVVDGENKYITRQKSALQGSVAAFQRLGFTRTAGDPPSGLDKVPINVVWCDGGGCAGGGGLGLSPMMLEESFDVDTRIGDPIAWLVAEHEVFHFQQYQYWGIDDPNYKWVLEGQARSSQDKVCIGADRGDCVHADDIDTGSAGYVPQVQDYLGNPNRPIIESSYSAALFWTYLVEQYGTSNPGDDVEGGMDLMVKFWEASADTPGQDGIGILNDALSDLGHSVSFRDVWKDFAVASYAKDLSGSGVPNKYQYEDMSQPGGNYGPVATALSENVGPGDGFVETDNSVAEWGAVYYELRPDPLVPIVDIEITQDSTGPLYYTVLGIEGDDLTYEYNQESRHFSHTLANDGYDRAVLVVAGLEQRANYRYSFNGTEPSLNILAPTTVNKARVGDPAAPDKFMIQVEVVDAEGTPLEGVNLDNFSFRVGSEDVPAGNVLAKSAVMGQHWFVVRAPTQSSATTYDLQVDYGTALSDTESLAVDYQARDDADSVLLVDRSGSMGNYEKLPAAKTAARLYVDSWRVGDQISVVSFAGSPRVDLSLRPWTDSPSGGSRQQAFDEIDSLNAFGGTAIGDTLLAGWQEQKDNGDEDHDWALVLLSDGEETAGDTSFQTAVNQIRDSSDKKPVIHTVAVGPDADRPLMQWAAARTGGTYQYVSVPAAGGAGATVEGTNQTVTNTLFTSQGAVAIDSSNLELNMDARYRAIATDIIGRQQFFSFVGPTDAATFYTDTVDIPVEGSAAEMVLSLSWDNDGGVVETITLKDPSGDTVAPFQTTGRHQVWRVPNPESGTWRLTLDAFILYATGDEQPLQPESEHTYLPPYFIQGELRSDVTMDVFITTPPDERTPGAPVHLVAALSDTGPITGATVEANLERPDGSTFTLTMYDDGAHDDGAADDGLYAGTYYQTALTGSYNATVEAQGTSPLAGNFTRQKLLSFHVLSIEESGGDSDGDGLPDVWEIEWGTDPNQPDADKDPDNDGDTNQEEYEQGTDPFDPDSDDDGEQDGSDLLPREPAFAGVEPTYARAYPGDGKVGLKFVVRDYYDRMLIYRGPSPDGPFSVISDIEAPIDNIYIDEPVSNGTEYCYTLVPVNNWTFFFFDITSYATPSTPTCATPRGDNVPPHGLVLINDGADTTQSRRVRLALWASDEEDPEAEILEDGLPQFESSSSGVAEMMISNRSDMAGASWEPYAPSKVWDLAPPVDGLSTVFVKYRDAAGNESEVYPATIRVEGPGYSVLLPLIID